MSANVLTQTGATKATSKTRRGTPIGSPRKLPTQRRTLARSPTSASAPRLGSPHSSTSPSLSFTLCSLGSWATPPRTVRWTKAPVTRQRHTTARLFERIDAVSSTMTSSTSTWARSRSAPLVSTVDDSPPASSSSIAGVGSSSSTPAQLAQQAPAGRSSSSIVGVGSSSTTLPRPPQQAPAGPSSFMSRPSTIVGAKLDPTSAGTAAEAECRSLVRRMLRGGIFWPIGITLLANRGSREWREVQLRFPHRFAGGGAKPLMLPHVNQRELRLHEQPAGKLLVRVRLLPRPRAPLACMTSSFALMRFFSAHDIELSYGEHSTKLSWAALRTSSDSLNFLLWLHEYAGGVSLQDIVAPSVLEADLVALSRVTKPAGWLDARWEETIGASTFGNRRATVFEGGQRSVHTWDGHQQNTLRFPGPPNDSAAQDWELIYAVNAIAGKTWYTFKLAGVASPITDWEELEGTMAAELIKIVNDCRFLRGLAPLNALPLLHIKPLHLQYPGLLDATFPVSIGQNSNGQHRTVSVMGQVLLCPKPLVRSAGRDVRSYTKIDLDVPTKKVMWWNSTTRRGSS